MASLPFFFLILSLSIYPSPPLHRLLRAHLPALLLWHWFILMYIYATKLKSQADLKWKLQLGSICVFILWTRKCAQQCVRECARVAAWRYMCVTVCEYALFYPFWIEASFLYSRVEFLSTSPHTAFLLFQPSPFLSSPAQISATDRCLIFLSVPDRTGESEILI